MGGQRKGRANGSNSKEGPVKPPARKGQWSQQQGSSLWTKASGATSGAEVEESEEQTDEDEE
eukprot:11817915-Heterocapsa_arctica.AAC.1